MDELTDLYNTWSNLGWYFSTYLQWWWIDMHNVETRAYAMMY